jgi:uncharacterized protein YqhQ
LISKAVKAGVAPCGAGCLYGLDDQNHPANCVLVSDSGDQNASKTEALSSLTNPASIAHIGIAILSLAIFFLGGISISRQFKEFILTLPETIIRGIALLSITILFVSGVAFYRDDKQVGPWFLIVVGLLLLAALGNS